MSARYKKEDFVQTPIPVQPRLPKLIQIAVQPEIADGVNLNTPGGLYLLYDDGTLWFKADYGEQSKNWKPVTGLPAKMI